MKIAKDVIELIGQTPLVRLISYRRLRGRSGRQLRAKIR